MFIKKLALSGLLLLVLPLTVLDIDQNFRLGAISVIIIIEIIPLWFQELVFKINSFRFKKTITNVDKMLISEISSESISDPIFEENFKKLSIDQMDLLFWILKMNIKGKTLDEVDQDILLKKLRVEIKDRNNLLRNIEILKTQGLLKRLEGAVIPSDTIEEQRLDIVFYNIKYELPLQTVTFFKNFF
ncbi:MAG: hypothetical protein HeimC3_25190 [Candidatus Heimdallarchaeota archaeon LC_3]|nr:MAG: hypothetical protein HeimC3_25190 [Candidatus Heimdallarchaeota archaeon LC_3]